MFVFSRTISYKFASLGGVDLTENGNSLEGFIRVGNQLDQPSGRLMANIATNMEYCYLPFCSKYCD